MHLWGNMHVTCNDTLGQWCEEEQSWCSLRTPWKCCLSRKRSSVWLYRFFFSHNQWPTAVHMHGGLNIKPGILYSLPGTWLTRVSWICHRQLRGSSFMTKLQLPYPYMCSTRPNCMRLLTSNTVFHMHLANHSYCDSNNQVYHIILFDQTLLLISYCSQIVAAPPE